MTAEDRELLIRIDERLKKVAEDLSVVKTEVKYTNGRVTALEKKNSELKGAWRATAAISAVIGAAAVKFLEYFL